jgi:drug/metabolite transporter (DMT)-like permease
VLANASASALGRHVNRSGRQAPLTVTTISMAAGALPLLLAGLALEPAPRLGTQSLLIIVWLALINTALAFTLWNSTLKTLTAVESSVINGTMMIWIPLLAVAFLGERVGAIQIVGLALAGAGTLLVQLAGPRAPKGLPQPPGGALVDAPLNR